MPEPEGRAHPRALILTADVGHGHVAAGRAVADDLHGLGCDAELIDGLAAFGLLARHVIRDGYRLQLRLAPWSFHAMYVLFNRVPLLVRAGSWLLSAAGRRRLRRLIAKHDPDVVVATHPALTTVLGRMRLRRQLAIPLCVTVTDLADYGVWCHRGADVHLVMHPAMLADVERIAGPGSAVLARPFVARAFLGERDPAAARRALELPPDGRVVAVSGGGWGVGDLEGAVLAALGAGATAVVAVAGDNARAQSELQARFGGDPRVTVLGFTRRMPELMQAADVLVHSTGGMTSLEAASAGCPQVAFGASHGHIRVHNTAMERLGLLRIAGSRTELEALIAQELRAATAAPRLGQDAATAGHIVSTAGPRIQPLPAWRLAVARIAVPVACSALAIASVTSDEAYSLAARPLDLRPLVHVSSGGREVGLVVRADPAAVPGLARRLAAAGDHASFAVQVTPPQGTGTVMRRSGDELLPELGGTPPSRWLHTKRLLAGSPLVDGHRAFLASPKGLSLGQDLLARTMHAEPIGARVQLTLGAGQPALDAAPGDVVVVTVPSSGPDAANALVAVAAELTAEGLRPVSVSALATTASSRRSDTAPPTTTARAASVAALETRS